MIAIDRYQYGCAARKDRGVAVCTGTLVPRRAADSRLLSVVREELDNGAAIAQVRSEATRIFAASKGIEGARATRIGTLQREIERLADAVAQLGLSSALRARLEAAELELKALTAGADVPAPTIDDVVARYRANLLRLTEALQGDVDRARAALAGILGRITIEQRADGVYAGLEVEPATILLAAGSQ
jgi:hypothetical protein